MASAKIIWHRQSESFNLSAEYAINKYGEQIMCRRTVFAALFFICSLFAMTLMQCQSSDIKALIAAGEFTRAEGAIRELLEENRSLPEQERLDWEFELERMYRIRKDFTKSRADLEEYIREYLPDASEENFRKWEDSKALEYMSIDGQKKYFNYAHYNLFRIDKEAKAIKQAADQEKGTQKEKEFPLDQHIAEVIEAATHTGSRYVEPARMRIKQSITIDANVVPPGETVRAWIPFPREIKNRQLDIQILETSAPEYVISDKNDHLQRIIYFQQQSQRDQGLEFFVEYEYTAYGVYAPVTAEKVLPLPEDDILKEYLKEEPPHIIFTPELRDLSQSIVGEEQNPYRIAQKLFEWVDSNIPWASAREYSTIRNLSMYPYINRHGDCGIQTLLFITLCRLNGIPAKWQSGWEFQPPDDSMHDWGEIYFAPFGWLPMDVTYGLRDSPEEAHKWFYVNGMDSYRLIFNDAVSQPFFPAKNHPRSETVDSQRGEVEWDGGNLYFDQWDWHLEWKVISK